MAAFRRATLDDADGVAALLEARDTAHFGQSGLHSGDQLRSWWRGESESLAGRAWVAEAGGRIVAFGRTRSDGETAELEDESCVHPEWTGRGLGSQLVHLAEEWARREELARVRISVVDDAGGRLLSARGYDPARTFWRMEIELDAEPDVPEPPVGIDIRSYRPGIDDRRLHEAHQDAFAEHWGFVADPFERWLAARHRRSDYDPALWQLALDGSDVAGAALCFGEKGFGWILDLFVGGKWRGRRLGLALLREGFRALWHAGHRRVGLEVDAANETGATRLYERAGMRVTRRYDAYEKRLAPATGRPPRATGGG